MAAEVNPPEMPTSPGHAAPRKSSGWAKVLVIVGGLTLLMLFVCAGVVGAIAWTVWPTFVANPADVEAMGRRILKVSIPPEFEAATGFKTDNFVMSMQTAAYRRKDEKGSLVLGSMRMKLGNAVQKPEFSTRAGQSDRLKLGDPKVVDFKMRGQNVPFRFSDAVDQQTKKKFRVVEAEFDFDGESKFFKLVLEEEVYDEASIIRMIESIQ